MLTHILIISLIVFAIHYTMQEGEIFGKLGKALSHLPKQLHPPLFECPVCMAPWYGSVIYFFLFPGSFGNWFLTVIPAMGLNVVLVKLFPDKETPSVHHELGEIGESLVDIQQTLKHGNELYERAYPAHPTKVLDRSIETGGVIYNSMEDYINKKPVPRATKAPDNLEVRPIVKKKK